MAKPGAASTIAHGDESQTDHGCKRRPDQATPAEMGPRLRRVINPANDQATDCAHHRGYASPQLLFGHSRHHGGGRPGCDLPQPSKLMAREGTSFWTRRAVGVGACPPVADRMCGSREGPCWAQMTCMCRHHVIVAAQPIAPVTRTSRSCAAVMSAAAVAARSEPSPRLSRSATRLPAANSWLFIGPKQP
jgi:hypothetical protein